MKNLTSLRKPAAARFHCRQFLSKCGCKPGHSARALNRTRFTKDVSIRATKPQEKQSALETLSDRQRQTTRLRSEAESPFRSLRFVLYGFSAVSASIGLLISLPQLLGALAHNSNALPVDEVLKNIGINAASAGVFSYLFYLDWQAREKQLVRLSREQRLANLSVELSNKKRLSLADLQGTARVVLFAGTPEQCVSVLEQAQPHKELLTKAGVLVVLLPIYGTQSPGGPALPPLTPEDLRWRATPLRTEEWSAWLTEQMTLAGAGPENGLFVGLRLDGRVRSSGTGCPPWRRFSLELAPLEGPGAWTGFMDGFDGRINTFE